MVHEVADREGFFRQVFDALVTGGAALYSEPVMHVPSRVFQEGIETAVGAGFEVSGRPSIALSRAVLLSKGPGGPGTV
jgi:hypothetical protein